jgi:hypothetical protein
MKLRIVPTNEEEPVVHIESDSILGECHELGIDMCDTAPCRYIGITPRGCVFCQHFEPEENVSKRHLHIITELAERLRLYQANRGNP